MPFRGCQNVKSYDDLINTLIPTTIVTSPATTEFGFYRPRRRQPFYQRIQRRYLLDELSIYNNTWIIMLFTQGLQEKFCKVEQDCFGTRGQTETVLKIEDLSWKYKNKKMKNPNKTSLATAIGTFRDSRAPSWLSGLRTDIPTEPPSHGPCIYVLLQYTCRNGMV